MSNKNYNQANLLKVIEKIVNIILRLVELTLMIFGAIAFSLILLYFFSFIHFLLFGENMDNILPAITSIRNIASPEYKIPIIIPIIIVSLFVGYFIAKVLKISFLDKSVINVKTTIPMENAVISTEPANNQETDELNNKINASHESGHIIAAYFLNIKVSSAVVSSRGGHTYLAENKHYQGNELLDFIKMLYAGTAAEGLLVGKYYDSSFGVQNSDIYRASRMIENYIFMKHPDIGKYDKNPELYLYAAQVAKECFSSVNMLLIRHMDELQKIYDFLSVNGTINENQIKEIIEKR